ncbi:MAG: DUF192 domain-containing protein [Acidimicrobiaceae bacterium]|nr:DUF192 domain-containing protein [Acidimicrobiaceae bacterium]
MHMLLRRVSPLMVLAMAVSGCSVPESTRSGGLVPPTGHMPTSSMPAVSVVTVLPAGDLSSAVSSAAAAGPSTVVTVFAPASAARSAPGAEGSSAIAQSPLSTQPAAAESAAPPTEPAPAGPTDGGLLAAQEVLAAAVPLDGFREGVLGVNGPAGSRVWPVIVADTPRARQRGLMGVGDFAVLGGYAAMVFIFDADTSGAFWMRDTPLPLRITFVTASGSVVSATDMVPCLPPTPSDECERYRPEGPYRIAIEHPLGSAFDIGLAEAEFVEVTVE